MCPCGKLIVFEASKKLLVENLSFINPFSIFKD